MIFRFSQHGALGSKRTCVYCGTVYSDEVHYRDSARISPWTESTGTPSPNAVRRWVRQWREEGSATCKKPHGRPSSVRTSVNIARETLQAVKRSFLTRVRLCIDGGGGHLKDILHKKWNYVKKELSAIVNCDVLKLVSVTFSKKLFLFIISSLFLPHPVFNVSSFSHFLACTNTNNRDLNKQGILASSLCRAI